MRVLTVGEAIKEFLRFIKSDNPLRKVMVLYGDVNIRFYIGTWKSGYLEYFRRDSPEFRGSEETPEELEIPDEGEGLILRFHPGLRPLGYVGGPDELQEPGIFPWPILTKTDEQELLDTWINNFEKQGELGTIEYSGPYVYCSALKDYCVILDYLTQEEFEEDLAKWREGNNEYATPGPSKEWFLEEIKKERGVMPLFLLDLYRFLTWM